MSADLVGRDAELARVGRLLEAARDGAAGVLAVTGDAGIGKTRLLRAAVDTAEGFAVLEVHGVEAEVALGHGALLALLRPIRDHLGEVPTAQADALTAALGWGPSGVPGDAYLVAAGTLSLLAAAAEHAPVLVVVDDLQWVDPASAAAVLFAARRLRHDRVGVLLAARDDLAVDLGDVERLALTGLSTSDAQVLLDDVAPTVAARLVDDVGGNPLALEEVVARLSPAQRQGAARLPDALPLGARLDAAHRPLVASLGTEARQALLLLAASAERPPRLALVALRRSGMDVDAALDDAEARGVLRRDGEQIEFRHPLLRSAVWHEATPAARRAAHRALADATSSDDRRTRVWHLAAATSGPDDDLASALAALADEERRRRGFDGASALLERAAALTADPSAAANLLALAVDDAFVGGNLRRTRALAPRVVADPAATAGTRARALFALGRADVYAGSVPAGALAIADAADLADGPLLVEVLTELAMVRFRLGDLDGMRHTAERLAPARSSASPRERALAGFAIGVCTAVTGEPGAAATLLAEAFALLHDHPELRDDPRLLLYTLLAGGWFGVNGADVAVAEARIDAARSRGALGVLVTALALVGYGRAQVGDHTGAFADAGEAVELAEQLGFVADAAPALELLAWESAARGLHDDAAAALDRAAAVVRRAGTADVAAHLALVRAFCALCADDLDGVVAVLEPRLERDGGRGSMGEPLGVAPLLVEAYVALDRRADAAALAARYAEVAAGDPRAAALVARCRALVADDPTAADHAFAEAFAAHEVRPDRFELARTRLHQGTVWRRHGRRADAREPLRAARDAFAGWDHAVWAARAEAELRATGETARPRRPLAVEPLTSQEARVARLVARGLSNHEVAAALFLSPKTVEHHLSRVYRKRGLRSRTELAAAFRSPEEQAHPG